MVGGAVEDVVLDGPRAVVPAGGTSRRGSPYRSRGGWAASKWHPSGIQVASKWHPSVRAHAEEDAEAAREFGMVVACIEVAAIPGLVVEDVLLERLGVAGVTGEESAEPAEGADALLVLLGDAEDGVVKACNDGCQWCE